MRRRTTILGLTAIPLAAGQRALAAGPVRIGHVIGGQAASLAAAFEDDLVALGLARGRDFTVQTRFANPDLIAMGDAMRALLPEIDLLVT